MEQKRESGYYWVLYKGNWDVAYYYSQFNDWQLFSTTDNYTSNTFDEIDEIKIIRNKKQEPIQEPSKEPLGYPRGSL